LAIPREIARNSRKNSFFILFPSAAFTLGSEGSTKTALFTIEEGFVEWGSKRFGR
jgi:hypothetical protein